MYNGTNVEDLVGPDWIRTAYWLSDKVTGLIRFPSKCMWDHGSSFCSVRDNWLLAANKKSVCKRVYASGSCVAPPLSLSSGVHGDEGLLPAIGGMSEGLKTHTHGAQRTQSKL